MKNRLQALFVSAFLCAAASAFCYSGEGKKDQFFAGVFLLQTHAEMSAEQKAAKFRELQLLTGITAGEAKMLLEKMRQHPSEWDAMYKGIMRLLSEQGASPQRSSNERPAERKVH